jgi:hypothetical protein
MDGYYKVPFRQVYCETLRHWLASVILCHVVYRLAPPKLPKMPHLNQ